MSGPTYNNLASAFQVADRFAESEEAYRKALELSPNRGSARAYLSLTLLALGRHEEAMAEAMRETEDPLRLWSLAIVHHGLGHRAESDVALGDLVVNHAEAWAYQIAEAHGARGEVDQAFEWLERAYELGDSGLADMKCTPRLRSLHGDPRWGAFLKRMGLED